MSMKAGARRPGQWACRYSELRSVEVLVLLLWILPCFLMIVLNETILSGTESVYR